MAALDGDDDSGDTGHEVAQGSVGTDNGTDIATGDLEKNGQFVGPGEGNGQFMAQSAEGRDGDGSIELAKEAKKGKKEKLPTVSFFRLFSYADKYDCLLMFFGTLGALAHGSGIPVFLIFFGKTLNGLGQGSFGPVPSEKIDEYASDFVYLGLVIFISSWIEVSCWMWTGERQATRIRTKYLASLLRQDVSFFDTDTTTGDFVASIASDPLMVQQAIGEKMGMHIYYMATFTAGLVVAFVDSWRIALLTTAVIPLVAIGGGAFLYTMTKTAAKAAIAYSEAGTIAEQAIAQVRTVYSFVSEAKFIKAYGDALDITVTLGARVGLAKGLGMGFNFSIVYPCFSLLLWYGGVLVRQGKINGGECLSAVFAVVIAGTALGQSFPNLTYFTNGKVAAYKIFKMIDHKSNINAVNENAGELEAVEGHIELRNVDFAYPARPDVPILKNFSLAIRPGMTVAIVGSSGSGKSTVVSLIERFYDANAGEVLLDGHDIKNLSLKWLRGQIGLVNQEPALFATTIAKNILYGKDNATQEEIEEAAKSANAHSFIVKLPLGYETQVGERGIQLSGGQKQRVAIARAMVRNPAVLLLDEATSALDAGSEQIVQEALDRLMVGRTTIVIAHRLSTIQNADSIAVVQQGQIIERGTHGELISRSDGAYSGLVRLQQLAASKDNGGGKIVQEPSSSSTRLGQSSRRISLGSRSSRGSLSFNAIKSISFSILRGGSTKASDKDEADEGNGRFPLIQTDSGARKGSFTRLIALSKPEWKYGVAGVLGSILAGCQNPAFALILGEVLTAYYEPKRKMKTDVANYACILAAIGLASLFIFGVQHYSLGILGENLVKRVREKMLAAILRNELGWYDRDENNSGQILARLHSDATNVRAALSDRAAVILQNVSLILASWILSLVLQWKLALVIIATVPLLALSSLAQKLFLKGFSGDLNKAYARATQLAGEAVANIRTVAAFNAEEKVQALFAEELEGPAAKAFVTGQVAGFALGISQCIMYSSYALGLWFAGQTISHDHEGFGNSIKVFLILIISASSMAETLAMTPDLVKGGEAVKSVFEVLDRETAIEPEDPEGENAEKIVGTIELKNVTFSYPSRPDVVIFKDLNLKVRSGRSLALVGASGSGKSSVIALIERFYDPIAGKILIDGKDLRNYNLKSVRRHIALVSQEPALFATSVYENILYGKDAASEAEVIEAAKVANAHKFISSLPDGYHTQVGERGVQLSGGQKQRVAIARAVLKDPEILLLDEATSALDAESEKIVQEALDRLMKGRTTIVIAHRLSTIRGADSIAVVQEGVILEEGSHTELLAKNGGYARLVNLQNQHQQLSQSDEISRD